jgi:hypothetical protein
MALGELKKEFLSKALVDYLKEHSQTFGKVKHLHRETFPREGVVDG